MTANDWQIHRVDDTLDIGGKERAWPQIRNYLASLDAYRTNFRR
ncbi:MAG: hypothetical protein AAF628_30835 [Planctomycetota bacterium]